MIKHVSLVMMMILVLSSVVWAEEEKKHSVGVGLGIPYGGFGGNIDINLAPKVNFSAGVGTTVVAGFGYNYGLKIFFTPIEETFRPRISVNYGIHTILQKGSWYLQKSRWWYRTTYETYEGLSLGLGFQSIWGKKKTNGFDFDIIYIVSSDLDIAKLHKEGFQIIEGGDPTGEIKISMGYRYMFK